MTQPIYLPKLAEAKRQLAAMRQDLWDLTADDLERLLNRAAYPASDGYGGGSTGSSNDVSKPTEAAVLRDAGGRIYTDPNSEEEVETPDTWDSIYDPMREKVAEFFASMKEAQGRLADLKRRKDALTFDHEKARERVSSVKVCQCCERTVLGTPEDRLRSGFCDECRKAWDRAGRPDRVEFVRERRAYLTTKEGGDVGTEEEQVTRGA